MPRLTLDRSLPTRRHYHSYILYSNKNGNATFSTPHRGNLFSCGVYVRGRERDSLAHKIKINQSGMTTRLLVPPRSLWLSRWVKFDAISWRETGFCGKSTWLFGAHTTYELMAKSCHVGTKSFYLHLMGVKAEDCS